MAQTRERRLLFPHPTLRETMWTTRDTGKLGEDLACDWLKNQGFLIIQQNYLKKWGEIDIVATKDKILHFFEVKSIYVQQGPRQNGYRPEENVHELKIKRLRRVIQTYLFEKKVSPESEFRFHVVTVKIDKNTQQAEIRLLENLIL